MDRYTGDLERALCDGRLSSVGVVRAAVNVVSNARLLTPPPTAVTFRLTGKCDSDVLVCALFIGQLSGAVN